MSSVEYLLPREVRKISKPFLLVSEGYGDARFLCALLKELNIDQYEVGCPSRETGDGKLDGYLKAVRAINTFHPILRGVLAVVDADDSPHGRFQASAEAIRSAGFPAPQRPFAVENSFLRTGVFLIPGQGRTGTLEHLLYEAAIERNPKISKCVDSFSLCMGNACAWTENQVAKMRMSAAVAVTCRKNPWASLGLVWDQDDNPIPIKSRRFDEIGNFLRRFVL